MNQVREVSRSYTVELPLLNNTNRKISFGDTETLLDDKIITGISVLPDWIGKAPSGRPIVSILAIAQAFLTLCDSSKTELNKDLPIELLLRNEPILHLTPRIVSIRSSYVDFPLINNLVIPAGGAAVMFVFFYEDFAKDKYRINGVGQPELIENY